MKRETLTTVYKLTDSEGWTRKGHRNACLWGSIAKRSLKYTDALRLA